jgi:hypothetical protein
MEDRKYWSESILDSHKYTFWPNIKFNFVPCFLGVFPNGDMATPGIGLLKVYWLNAVPPSGGRNSVDIFEFG